MSNGTWVTFRDDSDDLDDSFEGAESIKYRDISESNGQYYPNTKGPKIQKKLEPGCYSLHYDAHKNFFWFEKSAFISDKILDLPSPEYTQVVNEMNLFLQPETKKAFRKLGYVYKRSALLHGLPGTGKTVITNRVAKNVVAAGGICLWVTGVSLLEMAYDILDDLQPETFVCVIFEEFDSFIPRQESQLLTLLDGQVQKQNVMYLATTNYIDKIPKRLYRPGRFSSVIEVKFPIAEARRMYLASKLGENFPDMDMWVSQTEGLSVDELKEMVQGIHILKAPFHSVLNRIKDTKGMVTTEPAFDAENEYNLLQKSIERAAAQMFTVPMQVTGKKK